jgi:putative ABC transport system permease protein
MPEGGLMDTRIRKVWKDLAERKARSFTTLAGLVIGLWGIGAVTIAWVVLSNDLSENFSRTLPPNLVVQTGPGAIPPLDNLEGLEAFENRPLLVSRIEAAPNFYMPLHLYVVDDFESPSVARFFPQEGPLTPPRGEILIERSGDILLKIMRARAASPDAFRDRHQVVIPADDTNPDSIEIQLPGGIKASTRIAGQVFDPGLAPSNQEQIIYGYITPETANAWLPDGVPGRIVARTALNQQQSVAREISARLEAEGNAVASVYFPDPEKHPHQFQMDSIIFLLAGLGLLAFGIGAVLVINLVNGILTNQVRQIGSLKAMGATTMQVAQMYLASQMLLGLASSALALPLAVKAAYWVCGVIAAMLNFDILTTHISWPVYAALILAGGLLPVLAAWWPVRRWSRVAVRDALENHGTSAQFHQGSALDRLWLPLPVPLRAGLRNALRKPARFALSATTIAIGALIFMLAMNMRASILNTADIEEATILYDISISLEEDTPWSEVSWMSNFPVVNRVEMWPATIARTIGTNELEQQDVPVLAVPTDTWAVRPNLVEGQWLSDDRPNGVVATHRLMNRIPGLELGSRLPLKFDDRTIEVELVGVEKRFGPASLRMPLSGYLDLTGADPDLGRIAFLDLDEETARNTGEFIPLLESHFPLTSLKVRQLATSRLAARVIRNHLDVIVAMLAFVATLMLLVSGLGMASGTSTSVIERTREIGVLRAIGATPAAVFNILTVEALAVALTGFALALSVADPLSKRLEYYFGTGIVEYPFDHKFSFEGLALCVVLVSLLALAATLGPARLVTRGTVRTAVNYE